MKVSIFAIIAFFGALGALSDTVSTDTVPDMDTCRTTERQLAPVKSERVESVSKQIICVCFS
ncbi:hypothetical protein DPMN_134943 [Dreissena polymorpha]|uniref:Uncharacterized protein n=1 Tax=Dreissena polymorpha TaxID=45954 RepID=A0A9D4FX38_DREPO|nr:hypothetical protein DPMN_134943 [Dreissena polymorpha]